MLARVLNAGQSGAGGVGCGHVGHLLVRLASPSTAAQSLFLTPVSDSDRAPVVVRSMHHPLIAIKYFGGFLGEASLLTFVLDWCSIASS